MMTESQEAASLTRREMLGALGVADIALAERRVGLEREEQPIERIRGGGRENVMGIHDPT